MYFKDRTEAGKLLAQQLDKYRLEKTTVVALSPHAVVVGAEIARALSCDMSLMVTAKVTGLGEPNFVLGTLDQEGSFVTNGQVPTGEMDEYLEDMWEYLEEEKLHKLYDMVELLGHGGITDRYQLGGHNVILVAEGVVTGMSVMAALNYLKPIATKRVIAAIPVGPANTLERINQATDELHFLYIPDNFFDIHHYYQDKKVMTPEDVMITINQVSRH